MRRSTLLGLALVVLLIAGAGAYAIFWYAAAGRLHDGIGLWAQSLRANHIELAWDTLRVGGFPGAFRLELSGARLRDEANGETAGFSTPTLTASVRPWNFRVWRLAMPAGLKADAGPPERPLATLTAAAAGGALAFTEDGEAVVWLDLERPAAVAEVRVAARDAYLWLSLPPGQPRRDSEPAIGVALEVHGLTLPAVPPPFRGAVDEVAVGATLKGPVPAAPLRRALAEWRDGGGTLELDHVGVRWGPVAIAGSGTLALDRELQPIGAFSAEIEGYDRLLTALVDAGRLPAGDASLAGLALGFLARSGPDGRPQIRTSFTIQNGQMYLGPARIGPAPRIDWR